MLSKVLYFVHCCFVLTPLKHVKQLLNRPCIWLIIKLASPKNWLIRSLLPTCLKL